MENSLSSIVPAYILLKWPRNEKEPTRLRIITEMAQKGIRVYDAHSTNNKMILEVDFSPKS